MAIGMSDEFNTFDQRANIKVCGIGGGGGNAVGRMIEAGMRDVEFITINTDAQALKTSPAGTRLQIGVGITGGLGSGAKPEVGQRSAIEDKERVADVLYGADMVFLTAGLGGGTGTGATPVVAEVARETNALTVAIVTLPFRFEGVERMRNALEGLRELEEHVDTLIVVPNDRVAELCSASNISLLNAFRQADEVLYNGVRAISELITVPGLINLDFADVRTIMQARGRALMGIGVAEGEKRAVRAAEAAIICPLLAQSSIQGARGVIVNIKGGCDIGMREVQEAVTAVQKAAHPNANIIFGAVVDEEERPELQVTVIAAGFPKEDTIPEEYQRFVDGLAELDEMSSSEPPRSLPVQDIVPLRQAPPAEPTPVPSMSPAELVREARVADAEPQIEQFLFPEADDDAETADRGIPGSPAEAEEDLGIPAFMRRRKKK
jgi:cell division protein FtsZ